MGLVRVAHLETRYFAEIIDTLRLLGYKLATALKRQVEVAEANVKYTLPFRCHKQGSRGSNSVRIQDNASFVNL